MCCRAFSFCFLLAFVYLFRPSDAKYTTTTTGSSNLSFIRAAVKKPPVVVPKKPAKPVTEPIATQSTTVTTQSATDTTNKLATDTTAGTETQPVSEPMQPEVVTKKPAAEVKTQPIVQVTKPEETSTEPIARESRWQSSKLRTSKEGPAGYSE